MASFPVSFLLPQDLDRELLVGRVWRRSETGAGTCVVVVRNGQSSIRPAAYRHALIYLIARMLSALNAVRRMPPWGVLKY